MILSRVISIVLGYVCGLFPTGTLVGRAHQTDLTKEGSGNTGMTNSVRVLGWRAGVIVVLGDLAKTIVPIMIIWAVYHNRYPEFFWVLMLYAGAGAILGHNFPFYKKFKGGKGVLSSCAAFAFFDWRVAPICAALFFILELPTGYVSLGSLGIFSAFFVQTIVFGQLGILHGGTQFLTEIYILAAILTAVGFFMHRENIKRLVNGTERKFHPLKDRKAKEAAALAAEGEAEAGTVESAVMDDCARQEEKDG